MRVLIAGCGYVGSALAAELAATDTEVFGLRRSDSALPEGVERVRADLADPSSLEAIPAVSHVVYAASPGGGDDDSYRRCYVDGPTALLALFERRGAPIERFLLTTSTGVYGQTDGSWVDESSETTPGHHSGKRMLEGEHVVHAGPFRSVALRFGGIYGPGRTRFVDRVRTGVARTPQQPRFGNRIHRDDCAGALRHLLMLDDPAPVYVGVDRDPADLGEVQRWLASELDVAEPPPEDGATESLPGRRARTNKRCRSDLLVASGYELRYPTYKEGYRFVIGD